jgi:hypothetical protein
MRSDAVLDLHLADTSEGGRTTLMGPGMYHGIVRFGAAQGFDMRCELMQALAPGERRVVDVAFLCPEDVKQFLTEGREFTLWEGHDVGRGTVVRSSL